MRVRNLLAAGLASLALAGLLSFGLAAETPPLSPFFDSAKSHHTADGFQNPPGSPVSTVTPLRWLRFVAGRIFFANQPVELPEGHVLAPEGARRMLARAPAGARLTWVGHASLLIGLGGLNILTDPFFSERASPVSFAGPRRYVPVVLGPADLPRIDVILISHNHYDSLDLASLRLLAARNPETRVLVPLGNADLVRESGLENVREMDWQASETIAGVTFRSTPAIHFSARGITDRNRALWSGFLIADAGRRIWFSGDTATGPLFKELRRKVGPVDIALVPIGAYLPRDFMQAAHTTPEEAAGLARIMGAKVAVGMHWGTLPLGHDAPMDAKRRFVAAEKPGMRHRLLRIGETVALDGL